MEHIQKVERAEAATERLNDVLRENLLAIEREWRQRQIHRAAVEHPVEEVTIPRTDCVQALLMDNESYRLYYEGKAEAEDFPLLTRADAAEVCNT